MKLKDEVSVYSASVCSDWKVSLNAYLPPRENLNTVEEDVKPTYTMQDNLGTFTISFDREIRSSRSPAIRIVAAAPQWASENPTKSPSIAACVHHINILSYLQDHSSNIAAWHSRNRSVVSFFEGFGPPWLTIWIWELFVAQPLRCHYIFALVRRVAPEMCEYLSSGSLDSSLWVLQHTLNEDRPLTCLHFELISVDRRPTLGSVLPRAQRNWVWIFLAYQARTRKWRTLSRDGAWRYLATDRSVRRAELSAVMVTRLYHNLHQRLTCRTRLGQPSLSQCVQRSALRQWQVVQALITERQVRVSEQLDALRDVTSRTSDAKYQRLIRYSKHIARCTSRRGDSRMCRHGHRWIWKQQHWFIITMFEARSQSTCSTDTDTSFRRAESEPSAIDSAPASERSTEVQRDQCHDCS